LLKSLLRAALTGIVPECSCSKDEWRDVYASAVKQSVVGLAYQGIRLLPPSKRPPREILMQWARRAEVIQGQNRLLNETSARLTAEFSAAGFRSAVLKGQANARLYPDPFCRQCGDIDIWVEGGRERVESLLLDLKLIPKKEFQVARHHIHLPRNSDGVVVEVHFKPASGIPFRNNKLQKLLNEEILKAELVPEGFYAPSIKFALVMQLSHLQQHFLSSGLGFRQYADYFVLLRHSSEKDRSEVTKIIHSLGMGYACAAVMWVLGEVFGLERELMLCAPDAKRGKRLLSLALSGGNFGKFALVGKRRNVFVRWFKDRLRALSWIPFDPFNAIFKELRYWRATISLIPLRIKRRKIAL